MYYKKIINHIFGILNINCTDFDIALFYNSFLTNSSQILKEVLR